MGTGESGRVFAAQRDVSDISSQRRALMLRHAGHGTGQAVARDAGGTADFMPVYLICYENE
ncbi:hypothetical protein CJO71_34145 [Burkholderia ubonensis]|nr:hypothetical protein CJO71_34145 [Burkholderia ubonensis]PAJ97925.1 hypothetical protein CJO68_27590 [Burkholderia ubonensis]PAK04877.1 hypothetical protein CJO67_27000 [Burkholderia ubonensis]RQP77785.1 hypothetical protein DF013_10090 [Burkholderia ubonensis]RQP86938.1 hypothetical protein DF014_08920 [Burkholderia ubonensis]